MRSTVPELFFAIVLPVAWWRNPFGMISGRLLLGPLFLLGCAAPPMTSSIGPQGGGALADAAGSTTSPPIPPPPVSAVAPSSAILPPATSTPSASASASGAPASSALLGAAPGPSSSPYLGQTTVEIRDSLGPPQRVRGRVWTFVRETLDCDRRTETELTFRAGRVVDVKETRSWTGKTCL